MASNRHFGNKQSDFGEDGSGHGVKIYGDTSGVRVEWDETTDTFKTVGAAAVDFSSGTVTLPTNLQKGFIPLDLFAVREIFTNDIGNAADAAATGSGGILAKDTTPILERVNGATDRAIRIKWAAGNVDEIQFPPVPYPPDLDDASDVTVHLMAKSGGSTDTPTITVRAYEGVGDTEMGGATGALSDTLAEVTRTLTAANIGAHPNFLNISIVPGTHGTDTVELYAAWIEYTRKTS